MRNAEIFNKARANFMIIVLIIGHLIMTSLPASAAAVTFGFDRSHTHIGFSIDHQGFAKTFGHFTDYRGEAVLDFDDPAVSHVSVEIDVASVKSGWDERDEHIRGRRFLNAIGYPMITFVSKNVSLVDERTADVTGDLSINGQTHEVIMRVYLNKVGNGKRKVGFSANLVIERSRWGVSAYSPAIGEDVNIIIETEMRAL